MSQAVIIAVIATTVGSATTLLSRLLYERGRKQHWRELSRRDHVKFLPAGSRIADVSGSAIFIEVGTSAPPRRGATRDLL